jgi:ligand-binding sensor domain-containing protein/serine phosphatase RsbU (regulator of sigma subunit)
MRVRLIWCILLFIECNWLTAQFVNFKQYTTDEGLAQQFVYQITQNNDGFLMISTGNGLSSFAGDKFKNFYDKDGLSDNFITSTFHDSKNIQWIGYYQSGVSYITNYKFAKNNKSILSTIKVNKIMGDNKGHTYALTSGLGIVQLVDTIIEKKLNLPEELVNDAFINNDYFFIASTEGLNLYKKTGENKFTPLKLPPLFAKGACSKILNVGLNSEEFICNIESVGLVYFKIHKSNIYVDKIFSSKELKSEAPIKDFVVDKFNCIWVSCFGEGLRKLNFSRNSFHKYINTTVINTNNGLPANEIQCLFVDTQKNIWAGTYGFGLLQYVNEVFNEYRFAESGQCLSMAADRNNNLFIVNKNGFFGVVDSTSNQTLNPLINNSSSRKINYVFLLHDTFYVADEKSNSVFIFDPISKKTGKKFILNKKPTSYVNHIFHKDGRLYVSTNEGLYVLNTRLDFIKYFNRENGLLHNYIYSSFLDSHDRLWLASHGTKPYWIDPYTGKQTYFNEIEGMNLFNINGYTEDNSGNIWIATDGDGVFKYNKDFKRYTSNDGLLSNYCYAINKDNKNNIWIGHKSGLSKLKTNGDFAIYEANTQVKNIKMTENSIVKDELGQLWFVGNKAVFKHNIQNEVTNTVPPSIVFLGFSVNDTYYPPAAKLKLPYGKYLIKFNFLAISFTDPRKTKAYYILKGQEEKWNMALGTNHNVQYTGVTRGQYKFVLSAQNEDGFSSNETTVITITVDEPIWRKWWFISACSLGLIFIVTLVIKYRTNQLIQNKKILEQKINEQTKVISQEKEKLSAVNDQLNVVYTDLKDSINYAKNIQFSLLPDFAELEKNLDVFCFFQPKDVVGGDIYGYYTLPNNNQIIYLVDCTGHGVPGGFITVIAKAMLDKIILQMNITDCKKIIRNLNTELRLFFGSGSAKNNIQFEGLVISVCCIEYDKQQYSICTAGESFYYSLNGQVTRFVGNRVSVGYEEVLGSLQHIDLPFQKSLRIYFISDGFHDQFGGPKNKRFARKKIISNINANSHLSVEKDGDTLLDTWTSWKGDEAQIDDVSVLIFEVKDIIV